MSLETMSEPAVRAGRSIPNRPRRLRRTEAIRTMMRETHLRPENLIHPIFVVPADRKRAEIRSMPGVFQNPLEEAVREARRAWDLGIRAALLFGIPEKKDAIGSASWSADGVVQSLIRALRKEVPEMAVIADICLCEYTDHGHCGVLTERGGKVEVDNDETLDLLIRQSLSCAEAGADFVAPSDMMDGRVGAIRQALDERGFTEVGIIAYAAKFASGFYGPFREAAESAPQFGDRRGYQMDPANAREAMREIELDVAEGADMVMVKPALSYLDIIREARTRSDVPVVAYNVSGEYAMVKAAESMGWIDGPRVTDEILTSIRRAGADLIISYHAIEWAERHSSAE
ncbi:MAG TPA: porphobilinogen synthase [Thermoanaerobaculia bacterium]|nr:porphobilinogen synthase [Thermoanaerobaculia bacterium]